MLPVMKIAVVSLALLCEPSIAPEYFPAVVAADCGAEPAYDNAHRDEWFAYGDCSGDYGIIDAAGEE